MHQALERARAHRHRTIRRGFIRSRSTLSAALVAAVCLLGWSVVAVPAAHADDLDVPAAAETAPVATPDADTRAATLEELNGDLSQLSVAGDNGTDESRSTARRAARASSSTSSAPTTGAGGRKIGDTVPWYLMDARTGFTGVRFELRALTAHSEVWVQQNLDFLSGDCRNDGVRNVVTTAQVEALAAEFEDNILPVESRAFSVARPRDGSKGPTTKGVPDYGNAGDVTVILVGNIRDADYYAPSTPEGATYISGYFSPVLTEFFDRNIMTIDSYDWTHRTGPNPPATTATCLPRPALPYVYENNFAHEYQHLLEYYQDPTETTWLNEGLSMYAQTLTGYSDTTIPYPDAGAVPQLACFQGFRATVQFPYCGAENSLTLWGDRGAPYILADYGAVYSFVTYLADRFGVKAVTALHRSPAHGLVSLETYLKANAPRGLSASDVIHDWAAAMAVDGWIDDGARGLWGNQGKRFQADQLHSAIDWTLTGSYDTPGAPPNGSDYVMATDPCPVNVRTIDSISFRGADSFAASSGSSVAVDNWSVQLIGWSTDGRVVRVADLPVNGRNRIRLDRSELKTYLRGADRVGFVITPDDPTETATGYAPYKLVVNGTLQPGGGELPNS